MTISNEAVRLKEKLDGDKQIGTIGKAKDLVVVHRRHTGTSAQREAAARVVGHFYGSPSWDIADAVVEAWTNAAPPEQSLIAALRWTEEASQREGE